MNLRQNELARKISVSPRRINEIVLEKRIITPDTALRLAKFFKASANFWLNLQSSYDLEEKNKELKPILRSIKACRLRPSNFYKSAS